MAKTFAPKSTFTPGETNTRAVRPETTAAPTRGAKPATAGDTPPDPNAAANQAAPDPNATDAANDTATAKPTRKRAVAGKHRK